MSNNNNYASGEFEYDETELEDYDDYCPDYSDGALLYGNGHRGPRFTVDDEELFTIVQGFSDIYAGLLASESRLDILEGLNKPNILERYTSVVTPSVCGDDEGEPCDEPSDSEESQDVEGVYALKPEELAMLPDETWRMFTDEQRQSIIADCAKTVSARAVAIDRYRLPGSRKSLRNAVIQGPSGKHAIGVDCAGKLVEGNPLAIFILDGKAFKLSEIPLVDNITGLDYHWINAAGLPVYDYGNEHVDAKDAVYLQGDAAFMPAMRVHQLLTAALNVAVVKEPGSSGEYQLIYPSKEGDSYTSSAVGTTTGRYSRVGQIALRPPDMV